MKPVFAAIAAIIMLAATTSLRAQNAPAASTNDTGAATASTPVSGDSAGNSSLSAPGNHKPARPHHKKKQSLGQRLKSSVHKKLAKFTAPKKHSAPKRSAAPGKAIPQSQIE